MPPHNQFRHQVYHSGEPSASFEVVARPELAEIGSLEEQRDLSTAGQLLRAAGVSQIWLVHGTFVGNDALGWARRLRLLSSQIGSRLERWQRHWLATQIGDAGNFTAEYARDLAAGLQSGTTGIPVHCADWSSENHHIARADGAIRIIERMSELEPATRVLVWCHSHGGNVLALVTNLLRAPPAARQAFFQACRWYYRDPLTGRCSWPHWRRVEQLLAQDESLARLQSVRLDVVTLGTPLRYGWDSDGYSGLLHYVNHRPQPGTPPYLAALPGQWDDLFHAVGGDYVQQLAIAGTNFRPTILSWRTSWANLWLQRMAQREARSLQLVRNWALGKRVADEGTCLLVDYGDQHLPFAEQIAGHAVYTRRAWMSFHALDIARRLYGASSSSSSSA